MGFDLLNLPVKDILATLEHGIVGFDETTDQDMRARVKPEDLLWSIATSLRRMADKGLEPPVLGECVSTNIPVAVVTNPKFFAEDNVDEEHREELFDSIEVGIEGSDMANAVTDSTRTGDFMILKIDGRSYLLRMDRIG